MRALIARLNYLLGWSLFYTLARYSEPLHRFAMGRLRRASDRGDAKARTFYGTLLYYRGVGPSSLQAGFDYLLQAAQQGDIQAQFQVAEAYARGHVVGINPDYPKALQFYVRAAEAGHVMAALRLAKAFENGALDLTPDPVQAQTWMNKFLEKGQALHE